MQEISIPVSTPNLAGNEETYVVDAIRSTWISSAGIYVDRFEAEFSRIIGSKYASSAANGTAALHLALLALDAGPGDEIIIPAFTYVAVANAVRYVGATPVLVDVSPQTWCLDPTKVEAAITPKSRGVIAVHIYGHPCDMDAINAIAKPRGLWVVEDAAEAHFATYKGRMAGSLADIATFSFYGNKVIACGEGGALTYNDDALHDRIRMLRSQGMDRERRYFHPIVGYNYRLTNVACAILCAQLERRDALIARRNEIYGRYAARLGTIPGVGLQPVANWAHVSPWLYCVTIDEGGFGVSRDALMARLREQGVDTRPFFVDIHQLPPYQDRGRAGDFPVGEELSRTGMNLPTYPDLTDEQVDRVCAAIEDVHRQSARA
jgi:perosamine synthetase